MEGRRSQGRKETRESKIGGGKQRARGESTESKENQEEERSDEQSEGLRDSPTGRDSKTFRVLYCNARSLLNKLEDLKAVCADVKPDFILINETWANGDLDKAFFNLPGYEIVARNDRRDTSQGIGGGLLVYGSLDVVGNVTEFSCHDLDNFNQCSAIKIQLQGRKSLVLVLLYRPHHIYKDTVVQDHATVENNEKLCELLHKIPKPYIVVGDLNYSQINWDVMSHNSACEKFVTSVQDNFLSQHIDFPTHVSGTQPDVVLSSLEDLILNVEEQPNLGKSDHSMIMLTVAGSLPTNTTCEMVKDWKNANIPLLREELSKMNWVTQLDSLNTLQSWDSIKGSIQEAENKSVPLKRRRISTRPLWMQQNVMRVIRKKRRLWETYRRSKDYEEYQAYQKVQKEARMLVRRAKRNFEKKLAKEAKRKPKLFYSYLKSRTSNKQSVGPLKTGEKMVSDNTGMADILNNFFTSVFTVENPNIPEPTNLNVPELLTDVNFPSCGIKEKLLALKPGSAHGPDKVSCRTLKEVADILCLPLSIVFRRSMDEGVVPEDWRKANITPIFKGGSKMVPGNYRPVSLTCVICKVMESIIKEDMVHHLTTHSLIRLSQHGFMKSKSCQTNLLEYLDTLTRLVDEGHDVDVIYLDFAKAFDKVPHCRLLCKLEAHGISGKVSLWIGSWLTGRQQRVVLNGEASSWMPVTSGVPQGSVLGPICFIIFINDLDEVLQLVDGFVYKFADDTKYARVIRDEADRITMQKDIDRLMEWAELWQMDFNAKKCKIMHVGSSNPSYSYTMGGYAPGGTILTDVSEEKDIGVMIHNSLKPSVQCARAVKKANQVLGQMSRSFHYRDKTV